MKQWMYERFITTIFLVCMVSMAVGQRIGSLLGYFPNE